MSGKAYEIIRQEAPGYKWPNGFQSCVTYTVDVDGATHEYNLEKNISGNLSLGDYGPKRGVSRLLRLFQRNGIKASFFIPGWVAERFPEMVKEIHLQGHDVAGHGYLHENSADLGEEEKVDLYRLTRDILSRITGEECKDFRPIGPAWPPETIRKLVDLGVRYFFTTSDTYFPSKMKLDEGEELDCLMLNMNWALDDARYFWCGARRPGEFRNLSDFSDALEIWIDEFDSTHQVGGLFQINVHPRCSGRASTIRVHEKLIQHINKASGVWWAPVSEITRWVLRGQD